MSAVAVQDDSFRDFVLEQLRDLPAVDCRSMFGGHGLYLGGDFFAIVYDDRLYFRTDDESRARYQEHGSQVFRPNERQTLKSYFEVPGDVVEDRERLVEWAAEAAATKRR
jgi:DNA transformation protein and related proteins